MGRDSHIERTRRYLEASGSRRLEEARGHLADEVVLQFPNGTFDSLEGLLAASEGRYRRIGKVHESWDVCEHDDEVTVVSVGTLHGENAHGVAFEGVRYIDRILYRDGLIVRQEVFNDLAESGVLDRRPG